MLISSPPLSSLGAPLRPFFFWSGVTAWVIATLVILIVLVIPIVRDALASASLVRFFWRYHRPRCQESFWQLVLEVPGCFFHHWWEFLSEGRGETIMHDGSQWRGIGDWTLKPYVSKPPVEETQCQRGL